MGQELPNYIIFDRNLMNLQEKKPEMFIWSGVRFTLKGLFKTCKQVFDGADVLVVGEDFICEIYFSIYFLMVWI